MKSARVLKKKRERRFAQLKRETKIKKHSKRIIRYTWKREKEGSSRRRGKNL